MPPPPRPAILVSNDDGLDPAGATVLSLARALLPLDHAVVVVAPSTNNSACGQKISLSTPLTLHHHPSFEAPNLHVYSLSGSPADCVIVAIEPETGVLASLNLYALLTLSGVNNGPNMGPDILYSGTFAAARQSAMYGIPAVAASLAAFGKREDVSYAQAGDAAVAGVVDLARHLLVSVLSSAPPADAARLRRTPPKASSDVRTAFAEGNVVVNVNMPLDWRGAYAACSLDAIFYRAIVRWDDDWAGGGGENGADGAVAEDGVPVGKDGVSAQNGTVAQNGAGESRKFMIAGGQTDALGTPGSDSLAVGKGVAAVSTVSTWPPLHPYAVSAAVLEAGLQTGTGEMVGGVRRGLPKWMVER